MSSRMLYAGLDRLSHGDHSNILSVMCQDVRQKFCYTSMPSFYETEYIKAPSPH